MSGNVVEFPEQEGPPDMRGSERSGFAVIIENRKIPRLHMYDRGATIDFILDDRFSYEFPREWARLAASFAAQAMAIGEGYPWLGAKSKAMPFAPECVELGELPK